MQQVMPNPNPALASLEALVGEWTVEILHPRDPGTIVRGQVTFAWQDGGAFLVERSDLTPSDWPSSFWAIGRDDSVETYCALYYDSRGVSRIYNMSLDDGVWKLWRDAPGFAQRFTGTFSDDGATITAHWENSRDGTHWEHDFNMTYRKVR